MAEGEFYRRDTSLTRQLQTSSFGEEPNQRRPARQSPHLHQPPYSQGLNDYMLPPQAQPQQFQELFSRMDAMMAMISTTQQLALKNQTAHQQLQEKLDSLRYKNLRRQTLLLPLLQTVDKRNLKYHLSSL